MFSSMQYYGLGEVVGGVKLFKLLGPEKRPLDVTDINVLHRRKSFQLI